MQHGSQCRQRIVCKSPPYLPDYDPSVGYGPHATLGPQFPVEVLPEQMYDSRDRDGITELYRLILQGVANDPTRIEEVESKLVSLFGITAIEHRSVDLGRGEHLVSAPLWMNIKFWQHVSLFRDDPCTLEILAHIAPSIFAAVGVSAGTNTPLHTALWTQCGVGVVQLLLEHEPRWLMVCDVNGLRPLDLVIKHVQEADLFACLFKAKPEAAYANRPNTSMQLAAVWWKSAHVLSTMIEKRKVLLVGKKGEEDKIGSTARLLFEGGRPSKAALECVLLASPHMVLRLDDEQDSLLHTAVDSGDGELVMLVLSFMVHDRSMMHARRNHDGLLALEMSFQRSDIETEVVEEMVKDLQAALEVVSRSLFREQTAPHVNCGVCFKGGLPTWQLDRTTVGGYEDSLADVGGLVSEFADEVGPAFMELQSVEQAKKSFADAMMIVAPVGWVPDSASPEDMVYLCAGKARHLLECLLRTPPGRAERRFAGFCAGYCLRHFRPVMCSARGVTLMHIAAAARADIGMVELLERSYGVDAIYCADAWGNTPGHYLLTDPSRLSILPRSMTSSAPAEVFGIAPPPPSMVRLMDAIQVTGMAAPNSNVLARMLSSDPTQAKAVNTSQFTMLALAARANISLEDFKLIYRANKDAVRFQGAEGMRKMTPLHHCACSFDLEVLAARAKTTLVEGRLSNQLSQNSFRAAVTTFLLEVCPEAAHICDEQGRTPMHLAAKTCSSLGLVEMLLRHTKTGRRRDPRSGAESWESNVLDLKDASGNTPVSYALMQKRRMFAQQDLIVLAMLRDGVCMFFRNNNGLSLYHLALLHGYAGADSSANPDAWSVATKLTVERSEFEIVLPQTLDHMAKEGMAGFLSPGPNGVVDAVRHSFEVCATAIGAPHVDTYLKMLDLMVQAVLNEYVQQLELQPQLVDGMCSRMLEHVAFLDARVAAFDAAHPCPDAPEHVREMRKMGLRMKVIARNVEALRAGVDERQEKELAAERLQAELLQTIEDEAQAAQATAKRNRKQAERKHNRKQAVETAKKEAAAGREHAAAVARSLREDAAAEEERLEQQVLLDAAHAAKAAAESAEAGAAEPRPALPSLAALAPAPAPVAPAPVAPAWAPGESPAKQGPPQPAVLSFDVCGPLDFALRLRELEADNTRLAAEARQAAENARQTCSVCFGEHGPLDHALAECGHVFCRTDANLSLASGFCFSCRAPVKTAMRLYGL